MWSLCDVLSSSGIRIITSRAVARSGSKHEIRTAQGSTSAGNPRGCSTEATAHSRDVTQTRAQNIDTGGSSTGLTIGRPNQGEGGKPIAAANAKTETERSGASGFNTIFGHRRFHKEKNAKPNGKKGRYVKAGELTR